MAETFKTITNVPGWVEMLTSDGVPDSVATLYKRVPILFRAVQLRCDALSSVPVNIYKGEENEVEWPYPTKLGELLWRWEASCLLSGAAFGEIIANKSGFRKDVRYRNPFDMSVKYEGGIISFRQNSSGVTWQNDPKAGKFEMLYIPEYDPAQDVLPGVGSAMAATVDAKLLYAISKFPEMYFEGGAMPVTLLGIDTNDRAEIERIQNWFKKSATAIKNAFRILGVRAGSITPTTLTPPLSELAFPELNDIAKDNIAMAFGIKQTLLDSEAANYATAQEDRKSFYTETIMPRARLFEDALNTQLLARDGLRIEFKFNEMDIFQTDESERADLLHKLMNSEMPIELALDLAGYELTDDQLAMLRAHNAKEPHVEKPVDELEQVTPTGGVPVVESKRYNPDQPRVPAGSGDPSGQWTNSGSANNGSIIDEPVSTGKFKRVNILSETGDVVGYVQYDVRGGLHINEIFVEPAFRRKGLATRAIDELMKLTGTTSLTPTTLTPAGRALYGSLSSAGVEVLTKSAADPQLTELRKWQKMAEKRIAEGKELRAFDSTIIEPALHGAITGALETVKTVDEVKRVFDSVVAWRNYP